MIIGIDGSRAFIEGRTGTENYSYQLIRSMSLIDTQNRYLIYLRPVNSLGVKGGEAGMGVGVRVEGWPGNFEFKVIGLPRLWTQLGLAFRTFVDPLDVLFVPSHTLPLIRRPGLKTVITVHDLGAEYLPMFHQFKQVLYLKFMTHYQIKTATKVISVSKATKEDLIKRVRLSKEKIEVIYEGVDKTIFKKIHNDIEKKVLDTFKLKRQGYFLFVGTVQPRKNLERLIRAFAGFLIEDERLRMNDSDKKESLVVNQQSAFKLVLVGNKGWKSDEIYKLPAELGIKDKVRFLGRITDEELVGLYNGAMALTYPSLFEGFGLPIIEAMACECPVITSVVSSMPEVAGDAALLVDPHKEEEITEAMLKIANNDTLRSELIEKGSVRCGSFNWKGVAHRTIDILTEIKE